MVSPLDRCVIRGATSLFLIALGSLACRPPDPPPTDYADLGSDETPLLPTGSTWHDVGIVKGQADWHPFRKPETDDREGGHANDGGAKDGSRTKNSEASANAKIEAELRDFVKDYNDLLADGKLAELPDFFVKDQVETVKSWIEAIPPFSAKLKELVEAVRDAPGDQNAKRKADLRRLAEALSPVAALKLEIGTITVVNSKEAVGTLAAVPVLCLLPDMPPNAELPREIRFVIGEEDYWYVDSPLVPLFAKAALALQRGSAELDTLLAGARTKQATVENLHEVATLLGPMLVALEAMGAPSGTATGNDSDRAADPDPANPATGEQPNGG